MKVEMLYGDRSLVLELPEEKVAALLEAKPLPAGKNEDELIAEALNNPVNSPRLSDLVSKGETAALLSVT